MRRIVYTFRSHRPDEYKLTTLIITCKRNDGELQCFTAMLADIAAIYDELYSRSAGLVICSILLDTPAFGAESA